MPSQDYPFGLSGAGAPVIWNVFCSDCEESFTPGSSTITGTQCPACRRPTCPQCGDQFDRDEGYTIDGELYGPCCWHTCEECDYQGTDEDKFVDAWVTHRHRTTRHICKDCAHRCPNCSEYYVSTDDGGANVDENWVCCRCSEQYSHCGSCDSTFHEGDFGGPDDDGEAMCRSCWDSRHDEDEDANEDEEPPRRRPVFESEPVHAAYKAVLHDYNYKPNPVFLRAANEAAEALYLGWEIECEFPWSGVVPTYTMYDPVSCSPINVPVTGQPLQPMAYDTLQRFVYPLNEVYAKRDGSIFHGAELVSHPGTLLHWLTYDWSFANNLREHKWRSYDTETCGMHVHLSRDQFTLLEQAKMVKFFGDNEQIMLDLSRRKGSKNQREYADVNTSEKIVSRMMRGSNGSRYNAVNLSNEKTVEIRIFRGTLNPDGIKRNLALCYAIAKFVKVASLKDLSAKTLSDWLSTKGVVYLGRKMGTEVARWVSRAVTPVDIGC